MHYFNFQEFFVVHWLFFLYCILFLNQGYIIFSYLWVSYLWVLIIFFNSWIGSAFSEFLFWPVFHVRDFSQISGGHWLSQKLTLGKKSLLAAGLQCVELLNRDLNSLIAINSYLTLIAFLLLLTVSAEKSSTLHQRKYKPMTSVGTTMLISTHSP